jgi:HEAT repeats
MSFGRFFASQVRGLPLGILRLGVVLTPSVLLFVAGLRTEGAASEWFLVGAGLLAAITGMLMAFQRTLAPAPGVGVLVSYIVGAGWLWAGLSRVDVQDWYLHAVYAVLLVGPVGLVASYTVMQSGALLFRRSRMLAHRIQERGGWPTELTAVKDLPVVKAFREALAYDAGPAIQLLSDPRPAVRMAALSALEFRKFWRSGQAELVMGLLHKEPVPEVRAAAVTALANTHEREIVETLAETLRDHDPRVRKAAAEAIFWDVENRWSWIRYGVRRSLADAALREDGPLLEDGQRLPQPAVDDLLAWAAEKGLLSLRSSQTLALMYARMLQDKPEQAMPKIVDLVQNPHTPPLLRIEMARLLQSQHTLEPKLSEELLDQGNPAPLRLVAAESLLESGPQHVRAVITLRELAKLPNRELSLATASVVQRCLGVDLGLALGQPMPSLNSGRAIEVTRRLMTWAANPEHVENVLVAPFEQSVLH